MPIVKTVKMFKEAGNEDNPVATGPMNFDPDALGDHAEVFTISEANDVDSNKDLAATTGDGVMYFCWLAEESDVELCTRTCGSLAIWHRPGPGRWDSHACQLCLLNALAGKGFVGEACVHEHDHETPCLVFDSRKPMTKKLTSAG